MTYPEATIRIAIDPTNPGQFFACCGMLELADRLWPGAEGWFTDDDHVFRIACDGDLQTLLSTAQQMEFTSCSPGGDDSDDATTADDDEETTSFTPVEIIAPISLRLAWWQDRGLKPWAGSMKAPVIARAMARAINPFTDDPMNQCEVVLDPAVQVTGHNGKVRTVEGKPREPFYFDSRRGTNAVDRDVGFVPDSLKKAYKVYTHTFPGVEFLCLIGLQRSRPIPSKSPRVYEYYTWGTPCRLATISVAVCGMIGDPNATGYRFRNRFRTGQKKHKAFSPAVPILKGDRS